MKRHKNLKYIPLYIGTLLLVFASANAYILLLNNKYYAPFFLGLTNYIDYTFTYIELIIFSNFFYRLTLLPNVKKLIIILTIAFTFFFIFMLITDNYFWASVSSRTQTRVYTVEAIILLLFCLLYFIELFKKFPSENLKKESSFWVSTGLLFFLTCTLPFSFLENYVRRNLTSSWFAFYSIFYIFYILLFLMIIRAYLCKPEKTI